MKTLPVLPLWLASGLLVGCAAPRQPAANYGHPALNQAVQQTSYQPAPSNDAWRVATGALIGGLVGSRFGQGRWRALPQAPQRVPW